MKFKKLLALILSAVMALSILAGCGKNNDYSNVAVQTLNQLMEGKLQFSADTDLLKALQDAVQQGNGDLSTIRKLVVQALGVKDVFEFSVSGAGAAKDGQHGIPVCRVTGKTPEEAARNAFAQVKAVLEALPADGTYKAYVSMVKNGNDYYLALDLVVVKAGTVSTGTDEGKDEDTEKPQEPEKSDLDQFGKNEDAYFTIKKDVTSLEGLAEAIQAAEKSGTPVDTVDFTNYKGQIPANVLKDTGVEEVVVNASSNVAEKAFVDIVADGKPLTITVKGAGTVNKNILGGAQNVSLVLEEVTTVGGAAGTFTSSSALTGVYMPRVTQIGAATFAGCTNLKNVYLGADVSIGTGAFTGCGNLRAIYYAGNNDPFTKGQWDQSIGWQPAETMSYLSWMDTSLSDRNKNQNYLVYNVSGHLNLVDAWPNR